VTTDTPPTPEPPNAALAGPVVLVAGARPNFMKVGPLQAELDRRQIHNVLVHTGQHYDPAMSDVFFEELGIRRPDHHLEVGSGSHAAQTARIMEAFEPVVIAEQPSWVVVPGDVNSTLAASLVAAKLGVRVAHLEAGLRSRDWAMPEEVNRVVTDRVSDLLLAPSFDAVDNLAAEGYPATAVALVGKHHGRHAAGQPGTGPSPADPGRERPHPRRLRADHPPPPLQRGRPRHLGRPPVRAR
jgi:UDP-N-acetylglucosamine 2-epimerase